MSDARTSDFRGTDWFMEWQDMDETIYCMTTRICIRNRMVCIIQSDKCCQILLKPTAKKDGRHESSSKIYSKHVNCLWWPAAVYAVNFTPPCWVMG